MRVQHRPHQGGARARNAPDENERRLAVVLVQGSVRGHRRRLPRRAGRAGRWGWGGHGREAVEKVDDAAGGQCQEDVALAPAGDHGDGGGVASQ